MSKKLVVFILLSITLIFIGIKYGIFAHNNYEIDTAFTSIEFVFWIISVLSISLGALLYQDNEKGYHFFALANFLGIGIAYYIGFRIGNFNLGTLTLIISALLFVFHSQLKNKTILGFLCLAFCASFSIITYGVFELGSFIKNDPKGLQRLLFSIVTDYSIFIFLITLPLLALYNLNHSKKLKNQRVQTLDQLLGFRRSIIITGILLSTIVFGYSYYLYTYLYNNTFGLIVGLIVVLAPLIIATIKCFSLDNNETKLIFSLTLISLIGSSFVLMIF